MTTPLRKKLANPLKATSISLAILYTYWRYNARKNAFSDALKLVSGFHEEVMSSIETKLPEITEGLSYDDLLQQILLSFEEVENDASEIPNLLTKFTDDLVESMKNKIDAKVNVKINSYNNKASTISSDVESHVDSIMENLDVRFNKLVEIIGSDDDLEEIQKYYEEMKKTMRPRFITEISQVIIDNIQSRSERASKFADATRDGLLDSYRRMIDVSKAIRGEFISNDQARNLVKSDIQTRIVTIFIRFITYDIFEQFAGESDTDVSDQVLRSIVDEHFGIAEEIRNGAKEEIAFRVEFNHLPGLIQNRSSQLYLNRYDTIESDKLLSDAQKKSLHTFTKKSYDSLVKDLEQTDFIELYSLENMNSYAEEYFDEVLPEMKNYVQSIFIEFRSVLTRARFEGTQTCIVQFYEMRRALDYNFFYAMSEEEDFDLDKTLTRFNTFFDESVSSGREKMIGLARMPYIMFLYDDSFDFLTSLSEVLFFTDTKILQSVSELTSDFHDKLADSVGVYMDKGIEDVFDTEESETRDVVFTVYENFRNNMELQKVSHIVQEIRQIMSNEISTNVSFVSDLLPDLIMSFKTEATAPFDEEWMMETQKQFIRDDDADFDGMKRFVVEEMNKVASSKTQEYIDLVGEYIENQIVTIGDGLEGIVEIVSENVRDSPIGEDEKQTLYNSLESTQDDINGTISSVNTSLRIAIDTLLQEAIRSLDQLMDIITQNFFNTTLQLIVEDFQEWAGNTLQDFYAEMMEDIAVQQKILADSQRDKFESHVRNLVDVENEYRGKIEKDNVSILEKWSIAILDDYNIVSYNARRGILLNDMKNEIATAGLQLRRERSDKIWNLENKYKEEQFQFQNTYLQLARQKKIEFSTMYSSIITSAYQKYSDVLGTVGEVLKVLEGPMRTQYSDMYSEVVDGVLASDFNSMPSIDMNSICYSPGLLGLSRKEGDLPSIMIPHLILDDVFNLAGDEFYDGDAVEAITDQSLNPEPEELGATDETELKPHERIVFALSDFGLWEKNVIDVAIENLEQSMDQRLRENTCSQTQKPCENGTSTCENPACRDGYILQKNSHDVLCCSWQPEKAGFPVAEIGGMLAVEIALMFFTSPGGIRTVGKMSKIFAKKIGTSAGKMAKSLKMVTKFKKLSGPIAKANAKLARKMALKIGFKTGQKIGTKLGSKIGIKVGTKIATEVVSQISEKLFKSALKVGSSGPVGAMLLVFDIVSLVLDLWDPAGYNDVQAAGTIQKNSDNITKQFEEMLKDGGILAPMVSDPMYEIDPEKQGAFIENLIIEWFSDSLQNFSSANESRWELMPDSESAMEYEAEIERLSLFLDSDLNFIQQIICNNLDNTLMVRSSTINGTEKEIVGTDEDKDYDSVTKQHLKLCCLNNTGVALANSFSIQKTDFINDLRTNPLYRWAKLVHGFKVYEDLTDSEYEQAEREINRQEDTNTVSDDPVINRIGWVLEKVDPEREFWKQYTFMKENEGVTKLPERANFIKAWEQDHETKLNEYNLTIEATMEENIVDMIPCDEITGVCEGNASIEMIKNQTSDSPSWYPSFEELYNLAKEEVDENINDLLQEERVNKILEEAIKQGMDERSDKMVVEETKDLGEHALTLEQARNKRLQSAREAERQLSSADFSVFKNGFGQTSPLLSIKENCEEMGYGVKFNQDSGGCDFTRDYCKRYGLTFFYNNKLKQNDCKLASAQRVSETIFGTTVTRGVKSLFGASPVLLGSTGNCVLDSTGEGVISPYESTLLLDNMGLGASYSIWN